MNLSNDEAAFVIAACSLFLLGILAEAGKYDASICDGCEKCERCGRRLLVDLSCPKCDKKFVK